MTAGARRLDDLRPAFLLSAHLEVALKRVLGLESVGEDHFARCLQGPNLGCVGECPVGNQDRRSLREQEAEQHRHFCCGSYLLGTTGSVAVPWAALAGRLRTVVGPASSEAVPVLVEAELVLSHSSTRLLL